MRKILALTVAALCYFSTYSQEAEASGNIPTLIISPRIEVNPHIALGEGGFLGSDFGATSLYTFFDGSIGEHFSYSMSNHWLSTDPRSLYADPFRSDESDFIDWLTLSYSVGGFTFTLGKESILFGNYELDATDIDQHAEVCSSFWNKCMTYQWGAKVDYTFADESSNLAFHFASSPFGVRPFASKLFAYSLMWSGEYGCFAPLWSANLIEYERGVFVKTLGLGNGFYFDNLSLEADLMYRHLNYEGDNHEVMAVCRLGYTFKDKVELFAKGGYEYFSGMDIFGWEDEFAFLPTDLSGRGYGFYGAGVNYYPLRNSKALRLHAVVSSNSYSNSLAMSFGATYHFNLTETICKHK